MVHNVNIDELIKHRAAGHLCLSCAVAVALETLDVGVSKMFVTKLVKEENVEALRTGDKTWQDLAISVSRFFFCQLCSQCFSKLSYSSMHFLSGDIIRA